MTAGALAPVLVTAGTIFVAELGDKTLYTVLVLSSSSRGRGAALSVGLGAATAFVIQSAISVAAGGLLERLPHAAVRYATAAIFAAFGVVMLVKKEKTEEEGGGQGQPRHRGPFLEALVLVFLAEWGDMTQIGTAALVARFRAPVRVFVGAVAGLWAGTALAVAIGVFVGKRFPTERLRVAAGLVFLAVAVYTAFGGAF